MKGRNNFSLIFKEIRSRSIFIFRGSIFSNSLFLVQIGLVSKISNRAKNKFFINLFFRMTKLSIDSVFSIRFSRNIYIFLTSLLMITVVETFCGTFLAIGFPCFF